MSNYVCAVREESEFFWEYCKGYALDLNVMLAMMVARSFGMWICARNPEKTTGQVKDDLKLHPAKLVRIMTKGGLQ